MSSDKKKVETWMPLLVDKYLGDTTHLSTEQHGAYFLLLMSMWKKGGRLPNDPEQLRNIAKLTPLKWAKSEAVLLEFFQKTDIFLTQKRLSQELIRALENVNQKSTAGKASAAARAAKKKVNGKATAVATGDGTDVATAKPTKRQRLGKPIPIPPSSINLEEGSQAGACAVPEVGKTVATWEAYKAAYRHRYGTDPLRNKRVNGMLSQFVELVPEAEAPEVARHFVQSNGNLYVSASHPINLLVRDAEKLRMEWKTGRNGAPVLAQTTFARERQEAASKFGTGRVAAKPAAPAAPKAMGMVEEVSDAVPRIG